MKELSIEEKAKRYDEALKQIKECTPDENGFITIYPQEIFPELKESEGEGIRKALLEMVHDTTGDSLWVDYNVHKEDAIAWLEKQGEQKHVFDVEIPFGTDSELVEETITIPDGCYAIIEDNKVILRKGEQNTAWSEEDEEMLDSIIEEVRYIGDFPDYPTKEENELYDECLAKVEWLKSLKDRVQPQPKQEWGEEDEKNINFLCKLLTDLQVKSTENEIKHGTNSRSEYYYNIKKWLKSLRPQSHWKPSDEQMKCLDNVKGSDDHNGYVLNTLYNDLKKLKEE